MGNCDACKRHGISCTGGEWAREACEKNEVYEPVTNADRIRAMTDEELSEWLTNFVVSCDVPYTTARGAMYCGKLSEWLGTECE